MITVYREDQKTGKRATEGYYDNMHDVIKRMQICAFKEGEERELPVTLHRPDGYSEYHVGDDVIWFYWVNGKGNDGRGSLMDRDKKRKEQGKMIPLDDFLKSLPKSEQEAIEKELKDISETN